MSTKQKRITRLKLLIKQSNKGVCQEPGEKRSGDRIGRSVKVPETSLIRHIDFPPCAITAIFDILSDNLRKKRLRYGQVDLAAS